MNRHYDVAVIGLGAMGSASLYQLARSGVRAIGYDAYDPPHARGSSHGETRITRQAIGEGADYVPLALRSHELWREIESETGCSLFHQVGALTIARSGDQSDTPHRKNFFDQCMSAAKEYDIAHEILTADDIRRRFPQFVPSCEEQGFYEPGGGYLHPEACVAANLELATRCGARIKRSSPVLALEKNGSGLDVITQDTRIHANRIVVSAGAWTGALLGEPVLSMLKPTRQAMHWFKLQADWDQTWCKSPVFMWMHKPGPGGFFYGFPSLDGMAMKSADEQGDARIGPNDFDRNITKKESVSMFDQHFNGRIRGVEPQIEQATACIYTQTRDGNFLIDWHPEMKNVLIVSPCSGHGFKHSAAIGEAVMQTILNGRPRLDTRAFSIGRLLG